MQVIVTLCVLGSQKTDCESTRGRGSTAFVQVLALHVFVCVCLRGREEVVYLMYSKSSWHYL